MSTQKIWFITGAGRGMGVHIAKAALAAGYAVVATGRADREATYRRQRLGRGHAIGRADGLHGIRSNRWIQAGPRRSEGHTPLL
jgi:NAD(P)-dependent dehydrogenase (short-subunit alcohol dehydrogenase family)